MHDHDSHLHHHNLLYSDTGNKTMLYIHSAIKTIGIGLIGIFLPIILYKNIGISLSNIFFFFAIYSFVISLGTIFASKLVSKYGTKVNMLIGVFLSVVYYLSIQYILQFPELIYIIPVIGGLFSIFFRSGFHFDVADSAKEKGFGKKVAGLNIVITGVAIFTPIIGGLIVDNFGSEYVLFTAASIILLSGIPLLCSSKPHKEITFSAKSLKNAGFGKIGFNAAISFGASGYLEAVVKTIWPIFLFINIGSFSKVGIIVSLTSIVLIGIMYIIGKILDKGNGKKFIKSAIMFSTGTWAGNILLIILSSLNIFILSFMDVLNQISKVILKVPLDHRFYNFSQNDLENPLYGIIIHEVGIHLVKTTLFIILGLLFYFTGNNAEMLIYPIIGVLFILPFHYMIFREKLKEAVK